MHPVETTGIGRERFQAVIDGRVQGVGFRYHTQRRAANLGLVGYVRNRWDGTVEVVAEGRPQSLRSLLSWLRVGPRLAEVARVEVTWQSPAGEFSVFEVRY